eukprot:Hpha_TRINITY_DN14672_c0_g1::TRINITY_DN14672_c0_g1_i3::g.48096::m.48096
MQKRLPPTKDKKTHVCKKTYVCQRKKMKCVVCPEHPGGRCKQEFLSRMSTEGEGGDERGEKRRKKVRVSLSPLCNVHFIPFLSRLFAGGGWEGSIVCRNTKRGSPLSCTTPPF